MKITEIECRLDGLRPILFNRYSGDNKTTLAVADKLYLDKEKRLVLPAANLLSFLSAENTYSVARAVFGKKWREFAQGIKSNLTITPDDIPFLDKKGPIKFVGFSEEGRLFVHKSVARLKGGIPNPVDRPCLRLPWALEFDMELIENDAVSPSTLQRALVEGGRRVGLGAFRPQHGQFEVSEWKEV